MVTIWVTSSGMALARGLPGCCYLLTPLRESGGSRWASLGEAEELRCAKDLLEVRVYFEARAGMRRGQPTGVVYVVSEASKPGGLLVLSAVCSHSGCDVSWDMEESLFSCRCHGGRYERNGAVLSGPPPRPLRQLPTEVRDGRLYVEIGRAS
ncbi:MAG: ubiquinol-cytochrome c reductase iron-sulfur subunit [Planctomycetota bacterium]